MLHALLLLVLAAQPFWEAKAPAEWSEDELQQLMSDSPWARNQGIEIYLATARPLVEAEEQIRIRHRPKQLGTPENAGATVEDDYRAFMEANKGRVIVLAARVGLTQAFQDAKEGREMEKRCSMRIGRTKYKLIGHFPPTPEDPVLRLIFPRAADATAKSVKFDLYLPSFAGSPFVMVEFAFKEMNFRGKLEM